MPRGIIQSIMSGSHIPTEIRLHQKSRLMEIVFADGCRFSLPYEFLRVHSPSAEVRGHGPGQQVLQTGKRDVTILSLEPVGTYAVQPVFSDGHATGIYAWNYLHFLGENRDRLHIIDKRSLEIVKTITPDRGRAAAHVEFDRDGRHALVSIAEADGSLIVLDAADFHEVKRLPMAKPSGKYNVWNKITFSAGTSH